MIGLGLSMTEVAVRTSVAAAPLETRLAGIGDSITDGTGLPTYFDNYAAAHPELDCQKFSQGGRVLGAPGDTEEDNSVYGHLAELIAYNPTHATMLIAANDLNGTSDAQEYLDKQRAFVELAFSLIPALRWFGIITMLPYSTSLGNNPGLYGNIPAVRLAYNNGVRAGEGVWHNRAIPLGDHPGNMTDDAAGDYPTYSSKFTDGLHPSADPIDGMSEQYAGVMDGELGYTTGSVPTDFEFEPVTEAALSTSYRGVAILKGMGPSATVTVSKAGGAGDFRVGLAAFGTTAVPGRRNGDAVQPRLTSSGANNTLTSESIAAGAATADFDVTTIALGPPTVAWDPATKTPGAALTGNNRVMTGAYGGEQHFAYSTSARGIGSKVAFTIGSSASPSNSLRLTTAAGGGTDTLLLANGGYVEVNGVQGSNYGYTSGDVIELELVANAGDPELMDVLARKNGGAPRRFVTATAGDVFFAASVSATSPSITISDYTHWE